MENITRIAKEINDLLDENRALKEQLGEYERQGGRLNLSNSWKSKYKIALEEANIKLVRAGLEPVRIRKR